MKKQESPSFSRGEQVKASIPVKVVWRVRDCEVSLTEDGIELRTPPGVLEEAELNDVIALVADVKAARRCGAILAPEHGSR